MEQKNETMETYIKKGDLIIFDDKHKIYCGDSTDKESYKYIQGQATMTLTSPPYNAGKNKYGNYEKVGSQKYLSNNVDCMSDGEYLKLINSCLNNSLENSKYVFWNTSHTSGNKISLIDFMYENKNKFVDTIIWKKATTMPVGIQPNILNTDFEYVFIFTNIENNGKHIRIGKDFAGTESNVIETKRNMNNEYAKIHSALMTLDFAEKIITKFSNENDLVLDCFSGLGTTMMACIKHNRIYYGIELEPFYVEKTIERYFNFCKGSFNVKIIRDGVEIPCEKVKELCKIETTSLFDFSFGE